MKRKILFLFIFSLITQVGFSQDQYTEAQKKSYEKSGWTYSKRDSCYIQFETKTSSKSPNQKHRLHERIVGLSDNCQQTELSLHTQKDSIWLCSAFHRDYPGPNFFWTSTHYLIFEDFKEGEKDSIKVFDLKTKKVVFRFEGSLHVLNNHKERFYDRKNEILIFYSNHQHQGENHKELKKLDIKNLVLENLVILGGHSEFEYPDIELDPKTRKLIVKVGTKAFDPIDY